MEMATLLEKIYQEAKLGDIPVDVPVYENAKKDPEMPILYAGNLQAQVCFLARDLGRDEVTAGQPLYGAGGKLVRNGLFQHKYGTCTQNEQDFQKSVEDVLLTNTVPYKPIGNKAFSDKVKLRFRPFLEILFLEFWQGNSMITLGTEALEWFALYGGAKFTEFSRDEKRFDSSIEITVKTKKITIFPLPHPSPLNQKYYKLFPQMLQQRLQEIWKK